MHLAGPQARKLDLLQSVQGIQKSGERSLSRRGNVQAREAKDGPLDAKCAPPSFSGGSRAVTLLARWLGRCIAH